VGLSLAQAFDRSEKQAGRSWGLSAVDDVIERVVEREGALVRGEPREQALARIPQRRKMIKKALSEGESVLR